jgi:hypothetical protein
MKKKYLVIVIILTILIIFFYPRDCGRWGTSISPEVIYKECNCMGVKLSELSTGGGAISCYGIPTSYYCFYHNPQRIDILCGTTLPNYVFGKRLDKAIEILNTSCNLKENYWIINFTIKHDGIKYNINDEEKNELSVYLRKSYNDSDFLSIPSSIVTDIKTGISIGNETIKPSDIKSFSFKNQTSVDWEGNRILTISSPAGDLSENLYCSK